MDIVTNLKERSEWKDGISYREQAALQRLMLTGTLDNAAYNWTGNFDFSQEFEERKAICKNHTSPEELQRKFIENQLKIRMKAGLLLEQYNAIAKDTTLKELALEGWGTDFLNNLKHSIEEKRIRQEKERISDVNIYRIPGRYPFEYYIRCKIDGIQQPAEQLAKTDILQLSAETDRKELAMKYYQDTLSEEKEQLQGVKI